MGKNKARHLLHGILDLLPLFVIPIFAIYTRNENYNSNIEIEVQDNKLVEYTQSVFNGNFVNTNAWEVYRVNFSVENNTALVESNGNTQNNNFIRQTRTLVPSHKYIYYCEVNSFAIGERTLTLVNQTTYETQSYISTISNDYEYGSLLFTCLENNTYDFRLYNNINTQNNVIKYKNVMCFDMTQIFGEGNEPSSLQEFLQYFNDDYYDYALNKSILIEGYITNYNDTDVGSQFVYTLYNTVDKYFNMGNVFNMNDVYDWFILNIFGGNASMSVYIVWNIVLYEFVMDLLFLLYGLFMFFIDMCKRLMEKPLNSIK